MFLCELFHAEGYVNYLSDPQQRPEQHLVLGSHEKYALFYLAFEASQKSGVGWHLVGEGTKWGFSGD